MYMTKVVGFHSTLTSQKKISLFISNIIDNNLIVK